MRRFFTYLCIGLGLILAAVPASAQVTGSGIRGFVSDGDGQPVGEALIQALHLPTGVLYETGSNAQGRFTRDGMPAGGPYRIEVSLLGKVTVVYEDVFLSLGEDCVLTPVLLSVRPLGPVEAQGEPAVSFSPQGGGQIADAGRIASVPVFDRSLDEVLSYMPQALPGAYGLSVLAANPLYNAVRIDGAPVGLGGVSPLSLEQIASVRVCSAPFDVRESGFTGGAVDIETKSGSNHTGGSAYLHMTDEGLAGPGAQISRRAYGFTVGAPLLRDRLFLFAGGEYAGGVLDGTAERRADALLRVDWQISQTQALMARAQYLDAPSGRAASLVSRWTSHWTDRYSNALQLSALVVPGGWNDIRLSDHFAVQAGRHRLSVGTQDAWSGPWMEAAVYAQDEWEPNPRFLLQFGVRAEAFGVQDKAATGRLERISPSLSPRLGFRIHTDAARRASLRGGAGLYTGRACPAWLAWAGERFSQPQVARASLGYEHHFLSGWTVSVDALASKTLSDVFFEAPGLVPSGNVFAVSADAYRRNDLSIAPYFASQTPPELVLGTTDQGYAYAGIAQVRKHFPWGLDLSLGYAFSRSFSAFDAHDADGVLCWSGHLAVDPQDKKALSMSAFDRPQHLTFLAAYVSPVYGICRTRLSLGIQGASGQHFSYALEETDRDFNADACKGNSLLYIPAEDELVRMSWSDPASAARFENFIRADEYLSSHRGEWTRRNAGQTPFETRVDLKFAQTFFYDRRHGRGVELIADLVNAGALLSPEWGAAWLLWPRAGMAPGARNILRLDDVSDPGVPGISHTPVYSFSAAAGEGPTRDPLRSAWRCLLGIRVLF